MDSAKRRRLKTSADNQGVIDQFYKNSIKSDETSLKLLEILEECQNRWKKIFIHLNSVVSNNKSEVDRLKNLQDHTESMLKLEVRKRRHIEKSKRSLEEKVNLIRNVLMENDVDAAKKQIESIEVTLTSPRRSSVNPGRLDRSAGSLLDPINVSGEDLLSARRSSKKARRSSSFCQTQARRNSVKRELRSSFIRKIIANNSREHISSTGPESNDLLNGQRTGSINRLNRPHNFLSRTILSMELCSACGRRITFGKAAYKCLVCRLVVHPACRKQLVQTCVPPSASRLLHTPTMTTPNHVKAVTRSPLSKYRTVDPYLTSPSFSNRTVLRNLNLDDLCPKDQFPRVPALVIHCINEVVARGIKTLGIYRMSGSEKQVRDLFEKFMRGRITPSLALIEDIHVVCGCLKLFLRNLYEPLVTFQNRPALVSASEQFLTNSEVVKDVQDNVLRNLPAPNRDTLAYIMLHLKSVALSRECQMGVDNLCKIFGPTLVGYSCPDPQPLQTVNETGTQQAVVRLLFAVSDEFYSSLLTNSKSIDPSNVDTHSETSDNYFSPINVKEFNNFNVSMCTPNTHKHKAANLSSQPMSLGMSARKRPFFPNLIEQNKCLISSESQN